MSKILALSICVIFILTILPLSNNNTAYGLSCEWPTNITKQFENADVIFFGKAISKEYVPSYDKKHQDAMIQFSIMEPFKGVGKNDIVDVRSDEWLWGFNFTKGVDYIVFAYEYDDETLRYRECSMSGTLDFIDIGQIRQEVQKYVMPSFPQTDEDYIKYDLSKEERFALPAFIKKSPLPSDIRQSMLDWCTDSPNSAKNNKQFWDVIPIRILSGTAEFGSLQGKTNSFVVNSHASEDTCPPNVWMVGTFASENGDRNRFALSYAGDSFRYLIGEIQCEGGLVLITKSTDGSPACVKTETKQKLIERGWAINDDGSQFVKISLDGFKHAQSVGNPLDDFTIKLEGRYPAYNSPDIVLKDENGNTIWTNYDDIGHVYFGRVSSTEFCKEYKFSDVGGPLTINKTGTYRFIFSFEGFSTEQELLIRQSASGMTLDRPDFHCP